MIVTQFAVVIEFCGGFSNHGPLFLLKEQLAYVVIPRNLFFGICSPLSVLLIWRYWITRKQIWKLSAILFTLSFLVQISTVRILYIILYFIFTIKSLCVGTVFVFTNHKREFMPTTQNMKLGCMRGSCDHSETMNIRIALGLIVCDLCCTWSVLPCPWVPLTTEFAVQVLRELRMSNTAEPCSAPYLCQVGHLIIISIIPVSLQAGFY